MLILEYILSKEEPFKSILIHIKTSIESNFSKLEPRYKYRVPYYYYLNKPFCYLNARKEFVDLGFSKGFEINDKHQVLIAGENRNTVKSLRYYTLSDVDEPILMDIISNAILLYSSKK